MSDAESYLTKTFVVEDADARIRQPGNLFAFETFKAGDALPPGKAPGDFKTIPKGTRVAVDAVEVKPTGSAAVLIFAHAITADRSAEIGWTSSRNFRGGFVNETLGLLPPKRGDNQFGPNAAWSGGRFLGQRTLVSIVDRRQEVERIAEDTLRAYLALVAAAAREGIEVAINSGFRSFPEQRHLHDGFMKKLPGFNLAAKPGFSKHQNGIAFDIPVAGGEGNPTYDWLTLNGPRLGFLRTVNGEPWHWEFDDAKARVAVAAGTFKTAAVTA